MSPTVTAPHEPGAMLPADERRAAQRLAELLPPATLHRLVEPRLLGALAAPDAGSSSVSAQTLATALLLRHRGELFAERAIRLAVAHRTGAACPKRWTPGSVAALRFVQAARFDTRFAGRRGSPIRREGAAAHGATRMPPLADFQREVLDACEAQLLGDTQRRSVLLSLPTGGGKTRVASELVRRHALREADGPARELLWLAHTEELLEQAVEALRQAWQDDARLPPLRIERRFAQHGRDTPLTGLADATTVGLRIVVCTPQRLLNDVARLATAPQARDAWRARVGLIVIDEAHRAAAPQYRRVLGGFERDRGPRVLGLTATPFRQEYLDDPEIGTRALRLLFGRLVTAQRTLGDAPRECLQARGVLAVPHERRIDTQMRLSIGDLLSHLPGARDAASLEALDRRLMRLADDAARRARVLEALIPICRNPAHRVLYFGPSVHDAEIVAFSLRAQGVAAGFVSGTTRSAQRRREIDAFRRGEITVLCNCEVLTTGFDAPQVSHVVIARPTVSHVLFEQMVGRGLRGPRFGGTAVCEVIHFVDRLDIDRPRLGYQGWRRAWGLPAQAPSPPGDGRML